jgi:hypothetical protein
LGCAIWSAGYGIIWDLASSATASRIPRPGIGFRDLRSARRLPLAKSGALCGESEDQQSQTHAKP